MGLGDTGATSDVGRPADTSPPIIDHVKIEQRADFGCLPDPSHYPYMPPVTLTVRIDEQESLIVAIAWHVADRGWVELDMNDLDLGHPGIWTVHADLGAQPGLPEDAQLFVRVANAAGLVAHADPIDVLLLHPDDVCGPEPPPAKPDAGPSGPPEKVPGLSRDPTAPPDTGVADGAATAVSAPGDEGGGGGGSGCAAAGPGASPPAWSWLLWLTLLLCPPALRRT